MRVISLIIGWEVSWIFEIMLFSLFLLSILFIIPYDFLLMVMIKLSDFINGIIMVSKILSSRHERLLSRAFHVFFLFFHLEIDQVWLFIGILHNLFFLKFFFQVFGIHECLCFSFFCIQPIVVHPGHVRFSVLGRFLLNLWFFQIVCVSIRFFVRALGLEVFGHEGRFFVIKSVVGLCESVAVVVFILISFWLNDLGFTLGDIGKHVSSVFGIFGLWVLGVIG